MSDTSNHPTRTYTLSASALRGDVSSIRFHDGEGENMSEVFVAYNAEVDALVIRLHKRPIADSEQVLDGLIVDYDEDGNVIRIELLGLKDKMAIVAEPPGEGDTYE